MAVGHVIKPERPRIGHPYFRVFWVLISFVNTLHWSDYFLNMCVCICIYVCFWCDSPHWSMASSFTRFLDHKQRRTTVGGTFLDEWSARHRDLYLTTHNTYNKQTSMPPVGFTPTVSAGKWLQTYALNRTATGTSLDIYVYILTDLMIASSSSWNM
jgi:hypothetical protein